MAVGRDEVLDRYCAESGLPRALIDPHRRHFYAAGARRIFDGEVEDREEKWTIYAVHLLPRHLSERFAVRLVEALK